eukprot:Phypoly_transcript_11198.p1 GENE.Phypoly_transcript_11198~~Phypoly_transcript_11198.p1  ORF type:complete len:363 (+),score=15.37 Phypoly_transcript_11198:125-1213(+)
MWAALFVCFIAAASAQFDPYPGVMGSLSSTYTDTSGLVHDVHFCLDNDPSTWCATQAQVFPYIDLDLGQSNLIASVTVLNRQDCCQDRAGDFYILTKDSPFEYTWPVSADPGLQFYDIESAFINNLGEANWVYHYSGGASSAPLNFPVNFVARYVRIVMTDFYANFLNLADVLVYVVPSSPSLFGNGPIVISELWVWDNDGQSLDSVPEGYNAIQCDSSCPHPITSLDVNRGAGGNYIYILYKQNFMSLVASYVSNVMVISGESAKCSDYAGYQDAPSNIGGRVDLNKGAGGDYIWLCVNLLNPAYAQPRSTYLSTLEFSEGEANSESYYGFTAISMDLNKGAGGDFIWLKWYLRLLQPVPL